jgi:hypothetical protein
LAAEDEERGAWNDYLESTRDLSGDKYAEVEPWAWKRLQALLRGIAKRKRAA